MTCYALAAYPRVGSLASFVFKTKREAYVKLLELLRLNEVSECKDFVSEQDWRGLDMLLEEYPDLPVLEWSIDERMVETENHTDELIEVIQYLIQNQPGTEQFDRWWPARVTAARAVLAKAGGAS